MEVHSIPSLLQHLYVFDRKHQIKSASAIQLGCFPTHFAIHTLDTENFDSMCRCVVNKTSRLTSIRGRSKWWRLHPELASARHFKFEDDFNVCQNLIRSIQAGTSRLLFKALWQQRKQNLKSLERYCFCSILQACQSQSLKHLGGASGWHPSRGCG